MMRSSRLRSAAALAASLLVLDNCHDGLLYAPATGLTASADLRASINASLGSNGAAFDKVDQAFVQIRAGNEVRAEQEMPFAPSAGVATLRLEVPLRETSEGVTANVELRATGKALFRGSAASTLSVGTRTPVNLPLIPVIASLSCGPDLQITSYGPAAPLLAAALFATGDTIQGGAAVTWSTISGDAATVSATGAVTALKDGDVRLACAGSGLNGTRTLHVLAAVARIDIAPAVDTLSVGGSVTLTPTLRDANGNVITSPRTITWSSNGAAATVAASGLVTAVSVGSVDITAASGGTTGTAKIVVANPPPIVTTNAPSNIAGTTATLNGTVRPNGSGVTAWFEWGTDSTFASSQSTSQQPIANGSTDVPFSETISGLAPNSTYFYRAVAANSSGTLVRGATVSFSPVRAPTVTTTPAVIGSAMVLNATVNPNGGATSVFFQYVTTNDGPSITQVTPTQNIPAGSSPVAVSAIIPGFQFTQYAVTAIAANGAGTTTGNTVTFVTGGQPVLLRTTGTLNSCSPNQCAFMASNVDPEGMTTTAWFEVSSDTAFTTFSATPPQSVGAGTSLVPFQATAVVNTQFPVFIRAAARNAFGMVRTVSMRINTP